MGSKDSDQSLPEVGEAPLIIDVEFSEEEDETLAQPLDSIEEVSFPRSRSAMELPPSLPTPQGRARVVTVINQKGGVGKTTTVINIAAQIALRGFRVLVIDSDSQGNCATGLGVDKSKVKNTTRDLILRPETAVDSRHATAVENLHIIVGDRSLIGLEQEMMRQLGREKRMKEALQPLLAHYDLVLIDTPPSLGLVTINALAASDGVLVPVQTEYFLSLIHIYRILRSGGTCLAVRDHQRSKEPPQREVGGRWGAIDHALPDTSEQAGCRRGLGKLPGLSRQTSNQEER